MDGLISQAKGAVPSKSPKPPASKPPQPVSSHPQPQKKPDPEPVVDEAADAEMYRDFFDEEEEITKPVLEAPEQKQPVPKKPTAEPAPPKKPAAEPAPPKKSAAEPAPPKKPEQKVITVVQKSEPKKPLTPQRPVKKPARPETPINSDEEDVLAAFESAVISPVVSPVKLKQAPAPQQRKRKADEETLSPNKKKKPLPAIQQRNLEEESEEELPPTPEKKATKKPVKRVIEDDEDDEEMGNMSDDSAKKPVKEEPARKRKPEDDGDRPSKKQQVSSRPLPEEAKSSRKSQDEEEPIKVDVMVKLKRGRRWLPAAGLVDLLGVQPHAKVMKPDSIAREFKKGGWTTEDGKNFGKAQLAVQFPDEIVSDIKIVQGPVRIARSEGLKVDHNAHNISLATVIEEKGTLHLAFLTPAELKLEENQSSIRELPDADLDAFRSPVHHMTDVAGKKPRPASKQAIEGSIEDLFMQLGKDFGGSISYFKSPVGSLAIRHSKVKKAINLLRTKFDCVIRSEDSDGVVIDITMRNEPIVDRVQGSNGIGKKPIWDMEDESENSEVEENMCDNEAEEADDDEEEDN